MSTGFGHGGDFGAKNPGRSDRVLKKYEYSVKLATIW